MSTAQPPSMSLKDFLEPILRNLQREGHRCGVFEPEAPEFIGPGEPSFASQLTCELCGNWFAIFWKDPNFRMWGPLVTPEMCTRVFDCDSDCRSEYTNSVFEIQSVQVPRGIGIQFRGN